MAGILDDLGKRLTSAGKTTVQKTKELTDIARLNASINEEERAQKNLFLQLGREYFNNHAANPEEAFRETVQEITESLGRVKEMQKRINDIRGMRECEECGAEVRLGAIYCPACGVKLKEYVAPEREAGTVPERCTSCGKELSEADHYCPTCGAKIERPDYIDTVEHAETIPHPEEPAGPKTEDPRVEVVSGDVVTEENGGE